MKSTSLLKWRQFKQKLVWFKYIQATIFFRVIRDTTKSLTNSLTTFGRFSKGLSVCEVVEEASPIFSLILTRN